MGMDRIYSRLALTFGAFALAGCATTGEPNTNTCMRVSDVDALFISVGGTTYDKSCNDGRVAHALMSRMGDHIGNALGFMLYLDQNQEAKAMLEQRMGGKDKVKVSPDTISGLLISGDETSRSVGAQIYVASPEDVRKKVNDTLKVNNLDPRSHIADNLSEDVLRDARKWAREHAITPAGTEANATLKPPVERTVTSKGIEFTFRKQPAPAPAQ